MRPITREHDMTPCSTHDLVAGDVIDDQYVLIEQLGCGGMGEVWEAKHITHGERRALKFMHVDESSSDDVARFSREVLACSMVSHPGIVRVHGVGVTTEARPYMLMDVLDGSSVSERLERRPLPRARFLSWSIQLCEALEAMHAVGLVHRDLKPENLMLDGQGEHERLVVVDFGLAFSEHDARLGRLDEDHIISGTPLYLSPEQAMGSDMSTRSDVYSLGVVFYEWLTGLVPFDADTPTRVLIHHMLTPAPRFSERTAVTMQWQLVFEPLVMRMLDKDPAQRPDVSEILARLCDVRRVAERQDQLVNATWPHPDQPFTPLHYVPEAEHTQRDDPGSLLFEGPVFSHVHDEGLGEQRGERHEGV